MIFCRIRRITESLRLEKNSKFMKSTHQMNTSMPTKPYQKVADGKVVELPKSIWKIGSVRAVYLRECYLFECTPLWSHTL